MYPELLRLGGLAPILALLSHDNSDIAASAIQLLRELTDADAIEDSVSTSAPLALYTSLSRIGSIVQSGLAKMALHEDSDIAASVIQLLC